MYAGIDLGATNVRAVVGDRRGRVAARADGSTPDGPDGAAVTDAVLATLRRACDGADVAPGSLRAVGIGSIGPLDGAAGAVVDTPNLPDALGRIPLVDPVAAATDDAPVFLHNDTIAGVIGQRFYSDRTPDDMVYLTVSTGIGAGICVDGTVLSGWDGNAGEVGHVTVDPEGRLGCGCGGVGHWEAYCSGSNIPAFARLLARERGIETDLSADADAPALFAAVGEDPLADATVEAMAEYNARGVATIVHAYAPLVVYAGGAVALNNESLIVDPVRERLPDLVMTNVPEIATTTLGDDVVVKGALASAITGGTGARRG